MFNKNEKIILINQARLAIENGLGNNYENTFKALSDSGNLHYHQASFVTLYLHNELRGCMGTLDAYKPLLEDISHNAYSAAFLDPRFAKLSLSEYQNITIELSILSIPEAINFNSEDNLLSQIQVGVDGIVFEDQSYRATYLPTVWKQLETPKKFIDSLKQKSGLQADYWSETIKIYRYTTEIIN